MVYRFPAGVDGAKQARVIAVGQTAGSWDERFAHRADVLTSHLGEVVSVTVEAGGGSRALVRFPEKNFEGDLATLLVAVFGKYSMAGPCKVVGLRLPATFGTAARFGVAGLRALTGVYGRAFVMAIFKPALGLTAGEHAEIFREVAFAGIDIVKDDEISFDLARAPTIERVRAMRGVIEEVRRHTGKTVLFAANVTGRGEELFERARAMVGEGANALLVNALPFGLATVEGLARDPRINVPVFAHPALAGAMAGAGEHGISYGVLLGTLMAHAGCDAVLYPAHYGSLPFAAGEGAEIRDALRARGVLAVPSAGITAVVVPRAIADYGIDVALNAGTGIMDYEGGPAAGVRAFFDAMGAA